MSYLVNLGVGAEIDFPEKCLFLILERQQICQREAEIRTDLNSQEEVQKAAALAIDWSRMMMQDDKHQHSLTEAYLHLVGEMGVPVGLSRLARRLDIDQVKLKQEGAS